MKRKNMFYHTGLSSRLTALLFLSGCTFALMLNGCAMDDSKTAEDTSDPAVTSSPEPTESPESDSSEGTENPNSNADSIPQKFITYSDNGFTLTDLDWWISWEDVKEIKAISAEDIAAEHGIENYVNSSLWSDMGDCEVQEGYSFTEDNQLYGGTLDITTSSEDTAQTILNEIIQWAKTALPEPSSNAELWAQDTDAIVDSFLNLASGTGQQNMWDARDGGTFNIIVNSFEPTGSMTITLSAYAPRNTGGTVQRSIIG